MYTLNNEFEYRTLDEMLDDYVQMMFENDDYFLAEKITQEVKFGGLTLTKNFGNNELLHFQLKADEKLEEAKRNYQEDCDNQKLIQEEYYSNLI